MGLPQACAWLSPMEEYNLDLFPGLLGKGGYPGWSGLCLLCVCVQPRALAFQCASLSLAPEADVPVGSQGTVGSGLPRGPHDGGSRAVPTWPSQLAVLPARMSQQFHAAKHPADPTSSQRVVALGTLSTCMVCSRDRSS